MELFSVIYFFVGIFLVLFLVNRLILNPAVRAAAAKRRLEAEKREREIKERERNKKKRERAKRIMEIRKSKTPENILRKTKKEAVLYRQIAEEVTKIGEAWSECKGIIRDERRSDEWKDALFEDNKEHKRNLLKIEELRMTVAALADMFSPDKMKIMAEISILEEEVRKKAQETRGKVLENEDLEINLNKKRREHGSDKT